MTDKLCAVTKRLPKSEAKTQQEGSVGALLTDDHLKQKPVKMVRIETPNKQLAKMESKDVNVRP